MNIKRNIYSTTGGLLMGVMVMIGSFSCNKSVPDLLRQKYGDTLSYKGFRGKVLYIMMDGVRGEAVRTFSPPHIIHLTQHALFTYNGLAGTGMDSLTQAMAWANQMTGVYPGKHQVTTDDFSGNNLSEYPGFIDRLQETRPELQITAFGASSSFVDHFVQSADKKQVFENGDEGVFNATVNALKEGDPDLLLAQFHQAEEVGQVSGYAADNQAYRQAVLKIDGYIGKIMTALESRKDYDEENWLVIISSDKGGELGNIVNTSFDDASRNIFVMVYNPRFEISFLQRPSISQIPYKGYAVRYTYEEDWDDDIHVNATLPNTHAYNFGDSGTYTIQVMIKDAFLGSTGNLRPTLVSKRERHPGDEGWNIYLTHNGWGFGSSVVNEVVATSDDIYLNDNKWHVLTAVLTRLNGVSTVRIYTDGVFSAEETRNNTTDIIDNDIPLRIGRIRGSSSDQPDILITNLQIYDTAFSDKDVAELAPLTVIDSTHRYWDKLIGYWPGNDVHDVGIDTVYERSGHLDEPGLDFVLTGEYSWKDFNDVSSLLRPPLSPEIYKKVLNSVDIPFEICQWMGITVDPSWGWEGIGWPPVYTSVK